MTMVLIWIATVTHTVHAAGQNVANECDCNTELTVFQMSLFAKCDGARACVCVCVCVISLVTILNI